VTDRLDDLEFHNVFREQPQRPATIPGRRFSQPSGDDFRFRFAIQKGRCRRCLTLHALQRQLKPIHHKSLADIFDRLNAAAIRLANSFVRPSRSIRIRLQQDLSTTNLLRGSLQFLDELLANPTLRIGQSKDIFLVHQNLLVQERFSEFIRVTQPQK
jgi:hypothetical protein